MTSSYSIRMREENPTKYANLGKPWKDEEVVKLLSEIQKKMAHADIAEAHQRSVGSITSRLKSLAADYYFNDNRPLKEIEKYTGLSDEEIADAISKRQYQMDMAEQKKKAKFTNTRPTHSPIVTAPIAAPKDDYHETLKELLVVAKDIQRMMKDFHADSFVNR